MTGGNSGFEPVMSGHAIAVLKGNDFSLLEGCDAEEVVNSCWLTLQLIALWYRRLHPGLSEVEVVLHDSLTEDVWAEGYANQVIETAFQNPPQPFPEFPLKKLNPALVTILTASCYYITQIAEEHSRTYDDVVDELHHHYLEYLRLGEAGALGL